MWVNCEMSDVIQSGAPKHNAILPESHINSPCNIGVNKKKIRKAYMSVKWILVGTLVQWTTMLPLKGTRYSYKYWHGKMFLILLAEK